MSSDFIHISGCIVNINYIYITLFYFSPPKYSKPHFIYTLYQRKPISRNTSLCRAYKIVEINNVCIYILLLFASERIITSYLFILISSYTMVFNILLLLTPKIFQTKIYIYFPPKKTPLRGILPFVEQIRLLKYTVSVHIYSCHLLRSK